MVLDSVMHAICTKRPKLATPELESSPSSSTLSKVSILTKSIRHNDLLTFKKHKLHDPRTPFPVDSSNIAWNGPPVSPLTIYKLQQTLTIVAQAPRQCHLV